MADLLCICRVCGHNYTYNAMVGYDKHLCGAMCDGIEQGRRQADADLRQRLADVTLLAQCALAGSASISSLTKRLAVLANPCKNFVVECGPDGLPVLANDTRTALRAAKGAE